MHRYSHPRQIQVATIIAALSVLAAYALHLSGISLPWMIDVPSVIGFYGLFAFLFYSFAWKWSVFRRLHQIPNLNGDYALLGESDRDHSSFEGKLQITQDWTRIMITGDFVHSNSKSTVAWLQREGSSWRLVYAFDNVVKKQHAGLHGHQGLVEMTVSTGKASYFTGIGRRSVGSFTIVRQETMHNKGRQQAAEAAER